MNAVLAFISIKTISSKQCFQKSDLIHRAVASFY
jgi:hypothetical protein